MSDPQQPLTAGSSFGPYRLEKLIGRGGMGEVYRAFDTERDRVVAIKVLPANLAGNPVYRQRFQRESRAVARLREAHVIPIHDFGEIDGRLYIDMRLVDGNSLRDLLNRGTPFSPEVTVGLIDQVAAALDAAHREGLLHRDVKPDNILVTHDGFAYLADFGIARSVTDDTLTGAGVPVGSLNYMAPERFADGEVAAAAADVYALTCVLYECLTGARVYGRTDAAKIMCAHLMDPIPRPSLVRPSVPAAFDAVVARGMAKNVLERYRTAGALAAAARAALAGRSTELSDPEAREHDPTDPGAEETSTEPDPPHFSGSETVVAETTEVISVPARRSVTNPAPPSRPRRDARRRTAATFGVLLLVTAALGFASWAALQGNRAGTGISDASALTSADIELLARTSANGYKRANCTHKPRNQALASFTCTANPASGDPEAEFLRMDGIESLGDVYVGYLRAFRAGNCPGDPAGIDGTSSFHDKEVGRRACFIDRRDPTTPKPALIVTNESLQALAVYIWDSPDDEAVRDYIAKHNDSAQFQNTQDAQDPDSFNAFDTALLRLLPTDYRHTNCRHEHPKDPRTLASTRLGCGLPTAFSLSFVSYRDRQTATKAYQAHLEQVQGHTCAGTGTDSIWRQSGEPIGRIFCYDDITGSGTPAHPCLQGTNEERLFAVLVCTLQPDDPRPGPKNEADLLTWFQQHFG
ncbi:serine/threonine-protein kinase [Nocardia inohanensis]|uniref:serine/threonine-protein kinase n=1 Tax=Nocardia inohanensis TaxID=209246 RepID=UPI00083548F4|nr:serine/threonine-protein kinase [Nocardia inohanensis]